MPDIHPRLLSDCYVMGRFPLCHLLLMNDKQYPWCILVPDRSSVSEIYQLPEVDQQQLTKESVHLSKVMADTFQADKMNVAALGNIVSQLHIHHIVRYKNDIAWPAPVWGRHAAQPYGPGEMEVIIDKLTGALKKGIVFTGI